MGSQNTGKTRGGARTIKRSTQRAAQIPTVSRPPPQRREATPPVTTATPHSAAGIPIFAPNERAVEPAGAQIPSIVHEVAQQSGRPLDANVRQRLEPRLHADFSEVRIHTGEQAAQAAAAIDAQAYTVGRDVVFGAGEYQPGTGSGQHLLVHELAHVAQPEDSGVAALSAPGDASEREADRVADAVSQDRPAPLPTAAAAPVQRQAVSATNQLLDKASPFLAAATGSAILEGFDTGKADIKPPQHAQLVTTAHNIQQLLLQYPLATIHVIGHTDTVGTEAANLDLGRLRAAAVEDALARLGVPAQKIDSTSVGEAAPQAVKTRDETPNAKNRRVEIRFEPNAGPSAPSLSGQLKVEPPAPADDNPRTKPPDLTYHPHEPDKEPDRLPKDFWKPLPPAPKGLKPRSPLDAIGEAIIDPVIDRVAHGLSKETRDKIKQAARDAVKSGAAKLARLAAEGAGLKDQQGLDAIEKATEAAIQEKGGPARGASPP
jgi:outer membrane protein OmpA-like peptidoglycan-associated protein